MLNPNSFWYIGLLCFAIWGFYAWRLNTLGLKRDSRRTGDHSLLDQEI